MKILIKMYVRPSYQQIGCRRQSLMNKNSLFQCTKALKSQWLKDLDVCYIHTSQHAFNINAAHIVNQSLKITLTYVFQIPRV